jgi:hypothetical protein
MLRELLSRVNEIHQAAFEAQRLQSIVTELVTKADRHKTIFAGMVFSFATISLVVQQGGKSLIGPRQFEQPHVRHTVPHALTDMPATIFDCAPLYLHVDRGRTSLGSANEQISPRAESRRAGIKLLAVPRCPQVWHPPHCRTLGPARARIENPVCRGPGSS